MFKNKNMKKITLILLFVSVLFVSKSFSQLYRTSSGEIIFGFADVNYNRSNDTLNLYNEEGGNVKNIMRFTLWFHFQQSWHYDFNNNVGVMFGFGMRNIGFITEPEEFYFHQSNGKVTHYHEDGTGQALDNRLSKVKQRTYTFGMPVALKVGNFDKGFYFFAGGEYEYAFHYKEKVWLDGEKKKYSEWWGDEVTQFLPSAFAGVTFAKGATIKFKWYLENFMNRNHTAKIDGTDIRIKPYDNYNVQLFYVSLTWTVSNKKKKTTSKPKEDKGVQM